MAQTHDVGNHLFFQLLWIVPGNRKPFFRTQSVEIESPFRVSNSLVIRLPFHRALVMGWWKESGWDQTTALMNAVSGWGVDPYDESMSDPDVRQLIRKNIAKQAKDLDSEWTIMSAFGVDR